MGAGWDAALAVPARSRPGEVSAMLPAAPSPPAARPRDSRVSDAEILAALRACGHHRGRASGLLGITRRALQYRLAKMARPSPS
jgi:DNA-binding NtrC family response regulator